MKHARNEGQNRGDAFRADVTSKLIELLETVDPNDFKLPWHRCGTIFGSNSAWDPRNALTTNRYRGINWVVLALASGLDPNGPKYGSARFATYLQWQQLGGQVRAGSKGLNVIKVGTFARKEERAKQAPTDTETAKTGKYLKVYTVFAAEQVEGVQAAAPAPVLSEGERNAFVDTFIARTKAELRICGDRATCVTNTRTGERWINLPEFARFTSLEGYYGTVLHELVHWTSFPLGRGTALSELFPDGSERYAFEELVAELGAAMLCAQLGVSNEPRPDHAAYLAGWLKALRNDQGYLMKAAALAQRAVEHLLEITDTALPEVPFEEAASAAEQDLAVA